MKNILVTGANGFVGRNVVSYLSKSANIIGCGTKDKSLSVCNDYYLWDIATGEEPIELKRKSIDCVVHVAASLDKNNSSDTLLKTNCFGTFNIYKSAIEHNVESIIYISSLPIVGKAHGVPITEMDQLDPQTMYHATKAAGEFIVAQASHAGIRTISLRLPSPIGPGMPVNTIVPMFVRQALSGTNIKLLGKGSRKQNYLDVRDLSRAITNIINTKEINGVYNVGSKNIISNRDLAQLCIELTHSCSEIITYGDDPSDGEDWTTDDSKLRNIIGDYQLISMEQSIKDIAEVLI